MNNLKQCGIALSLYADVYKRYPHQRDSSGKPIPPDAVVQGRPGGYLTTEWNEVVRLGVVSQFDAPIISGGLIHDQRLLIFGCPDLEGPLQLIGPEGDTFSINYNYVGGASKWLNFDGVTDPAYSPFKPEDNPSWTLMADFIYYGGPQSQQSGWVKELNAHRENNGEPAGGNHLFNDGHVSWFKLNGGSRYVNQYYLGRRK